MDSSGHRERRPWSDDEDRLLREAIQREDPGASPPSKWHAIATHVPNRTNKDCRKRWWAQMATTVAKGGWSHEEDDRLTAAVEEFGTKWALVATRVATRNSGQCAKRWNDALNPNIDRSEWTDEEDVKLLEAVKQQGKAWTNIVRTSLPGRTGLSAKNRYNHLTRATTERSRDRRKPSANIGAPYSRPGHVAQLPPPASTSTGSTPPHMSRDHSPLTPADSQPFYAQHTHHAFPGTKPEPEGYPRPEYDGRPNLTLAPPGTIPVQDRLGYSPHTMPGSGGVPMYPTPAYRLTDPSPTHSPRSAYPAPGQGYFPQPPHGQPSEMHRGGYHSGPATPAPPHEQPPAQHNGSYFGAPSQLTGLPQMSRVPPQQAQPPRAPTLAQYTNHYDPRAMASQHVQQQQHQQQQQQQHYEHPPPPHSASAADSQHQFRLPSMQATAMLAEQWSQ